LNPWVKNFRYFFEDFQNYELLRETEYKLLLEKVVGAA